MSEDKDAVRLDLWLWAVRLYKTRGLAGEACRKHQVHVNGIAAKPSRRVREGDRIALQKGGLTRELEVLALLERRVGAPKVPDYLADHTPPERLAEAEARRRADREAAPRREQGRGRPTKKDRREMESLESFDALESEVEDRDRAIRRLMRGSSRSTRRK